MNIRTQRLPATRLLLLLAALALTAAPLRADTIRVPKDQPTIQAAVDAASPGDLILVWPGVYVEDVVIGTTADLTIRGKGKAELRAASQSASAYALSAGKADRLRLERLRFGADGPTSGARLNSCTGAMVTDCTFEGLNTGLRIENGRSVLVQDNTLRDVNTGIALSDGNRVTVTGNKLSEAHIYGIHDSGADTSWITGNSVRKSEGSGIYVTGSSHHVTVGGNDLSKVLEGIHLAGSDHAAIGNSIKGADTGIVLGVGGNGVSMLARGNIIVAASFAGIRCVATESQILDNTVKKAGGDGIRVDTDQVLVSGNTVQAAGGHGIALDGSLNSAVGNRVKKSFDDDIWTSGSSNDVVWNQVSGGK